MTEEGRLLRQRRIDYMHARYYSSSLGRFLSVDPVGGKVGSSQSWNRYSYVGNNPVLLNDPTGKVDQNGFDAHNNIPGPSAPPLTDAERQQVQKRSAVAAGVAVSVGVAYLTAGESLLWSATVSGPLSNLIAGFTTRGMGGDPTTNPTDVGPMVVDVGLGSISGLGANLIADRKTAMAIDDALGGGVARVLSTVLSNFGPNIATELAEVLMGGEDNMTAWEGSATTPESLSLHTESDHQSFLDYPATEQRLVEQN